MRILSRSCAVAMVTAGLLVAAALAADLRSREARREIARALALGDADSVRIKNIGGAIGGTAVVEATVETAFRMKQDKEGVWRAVEVRLGDGRWESVELVETAVRKEKALRTAAALQEIAEALERYRAARGRYVAADSGAALIDNLAPEFMKTILRIDAWSNEFDYQGTPSSYRLSSRGADGIPESGDEIVIENGRMVRGTTE